MDNDGLHVLHWRPEEDRWVEVAWDDFAAFRAMFTPFRPLLGVSAGIHYFVVCACGEGQTVNIIPHKYLVGTDGEVERDNFYGWNKEEREDYSRLMVAMEQKSGDKERLHEIRTKAGNAIHPPRESLYPLVRALPFPPAKGRLAVEFLDEIAAMAN